MNTKPTAGPRPRRNAERTAATRARLQAQGLQRIECWVDPLDIAAVRAFVARLAQARVKR